MRISYLLIAVTLLFCNMNAQAQESPFVAMKKMMTPISTENNTVDKNELSAYKLDSECIYLFWNADAKDGKYIIDDKYIIERTPCAEEKAVPETATTT